MTILPTDIFEDISVETVETVQGLFIPFTSLKGLTPAEADPDTGNGAEIIRVLAATAIEKLEMIPLADRPTKFNWRYATPSNNARVTQEISFFFNVTVPPNAYVIEAEPIPQPPITP